MASSVPSNLGKLTVPQLKSLCKERRITGYSKLGKAALLQKLAEATASTTTTTPSNDQAGQNATAVSPITPLDEVQNPAYIEPSTTHRDGNTAHQSVQQSTAGNTESTETSAKAPLPTEPPKSSQNRTVASATRTGKTSGAKRPTHIDISAPQKRVRTSLKSATNAGQGHELSVPRGSTFQQTLPVDSSVFKVPELPAQPKRSFHSTSTLAKQPSKTSKRSAIAHQIAGCPGRFKPLVALRPKPIEPDQTNEGPSRAADSILVFDIHPTPLPVLSHISYPPKASERRSVYRWAIILSALSPADRQVCRLVSRTFRYGVYLSAIHVLSRNYPGRRLDTILEQYPQNMTNLWPYLRFRTIEVSERRRAFEQSFLGKYTSSIGYNPLSEHLWTNPDDEKQVDVALRFILTRMWFAASVGAYGHDASTWSKCVIRDVREVVKGEICQIIAQDHGTGESCSFYVLEATCEVIGCPPSLRGDKILGYRLRADWTAWISQRSLVPLDAGPWSLLECVKWSNTEDYHRGISKAWLCRVQGQDADNVAKRSVAERYILASVVANGVSGPWMSTSAMAQEFAGLPGNHALGSRTTARTVNMYLPAHHHIESVHFTTSKSEVLHAAVAVVQTPGREYYVLRDNGMQVGCEEEGIPQVWRQILGCNMLGQAC